MEGTWQQMELAPSFPSELISKGGGRDLSEALACIIYFVFFKL